VAVFAQYDKQHVEQVPQRGLVQQRFDVLALVVRGPGRNDAR
jgi:hypothetical protein